MAIQISGNNVIDNSRQISAIGVNTISGVLVSSGIVTASSVAGIVTYYGDGTNLIADGFNSGITTTFSAVLTGIGSTVFTFPSTANREYIVSSIHAANVGLNTEVNVIGAFDFNGRERSYFAYNIPLASGTAVELLSQPQVLNSSDRITMRSTDSLRVGINNAIQVHITYQERVATNYFGIGFGDASGITTTNLIGIYTATGNPAVLQSIRLTNRSDLGAYPISVTVTSGVTTRSLANNLVIPKYASVELLETQKRLNLNEVLKIKVEQLSTIDVQISGKVIP